jgi:hypothetical protein
MCVELSRQEEKEQNKVATLRLWNSLSSVNVVILQEISHGFRVVQRYGDDL